VSSLEISGKGVLFLATRFWINLIGQSVVKIFTF
jgi:hypothetical protein